MEEKGENQIGAVLMLAFPTGFQSPQVVVRMKLEWFALLVHGEIELEWKR